MSDSDQIMFGTRATVDDLAARIVSALDLTVKRSEQAGFLYVQRPAKSVPSSTVSGTFNVTHDDEIDADDPSVIDGYPIDLDIYLIPKNDDILTIETRALFDDLTQVIDVPMIYIRNSAHLIAAFQPGFGVTEFSEKVTAYADSQSAWQPFALNRADLR